MHLAFPFSISDAGRVRTADDQEYVRSLIEIVLFTRPGDRVNRPDFGCAIQDFVYEPLSTDMTQPLGQTIAAQLGYWLSDVIEVEQVLAEGQDGTLHVRVRYRMLRELEVREHTFIGGAREHFTP